MGTAEMLFVWFALFLNFIRAAGITNRTEERMADRSGKSQSRRDEDIRPV